VKIFKPDLSNKITIPLFVSTVKAGFPSPAENYIEARLDLNSYLIPNPNSTFFVKVEGDSMIEIGIYNDDLAIVDRSIEPKNLDIVIAVVDGEMTIKRLVKTKNGITLCAENTTYDPICFSEGQELLIWGVVIHTIRTIKSK
jgi:DNA polymerase V